MKSTKLKVNILTTFTVLIFLAVICEIIYSSFATKNLILNFEKEYYSKTVLNAASKRIDDYFEKVELFADLLAADVYNLSDVESTKNTFLTGINKVDCAQNAYAGFNDGSFFQVGKIEPGTKLKTDSNEIVPEKTSVFVEKIYKKEKNDTSLFQHWSYLDGDLDVIDDESIANTKYSPVKRGWYIEAEMKKRGVWSEIYQDAASKLLCVSFSTPIKAKNSNEIIGVSGVDITLTRLKNLLDFAKTSENAQCYMVSDKDEVIAYSEIETASQKDAESQIPKLITIAEFKDTNLQSAAKLLIGQDEVHGSFSTKDITYLCSKAKLSKLPFTLIVISPESDFTGALPGIQLYMLLISLGILLLSIIVIYFLSKKISGPIVSLCNSANAIGKLDFENYPEPPSSSIKEIQELSSAVSSMKLSITTFTKYAPKDLVKKMLTLGLSPKLGGKSKKITIFFTDIEGFSTVSERLPAEYLILHLSEYFDELTKNIMEHGGVIDKYIGDSIMAIWGSLNKDDDQAINACRTALSCQRLLKELKIKWAPLGKPHLPTRIGIHTGEAIVGNIGCQDRMNYTAIGDSVNLASRLESANKFYGTYMLVSEDVEKEARGQILFRVVDRIAVKGKANGIIVFEPLCALDDQNNPEYYKNIEFCAKAKEAFDLYQGKQFKKASELYLNLIQNFPEFTKSLEFLKERCDNMAKNPPKDWDGIFRLENK